MMRKILWSERKLACDSNQHHITERSTTTGWGGGGGGGDEEVAHKYRYLHSRKQQPRSGFPASAALELLLFRGLRLVTCRSIFPGVIMRIPLRAIAFIATRK